ncbi:MAG: hypothetical protein M5U34_35660 [Chloroflexi bacterium]|nr:hypothetical protein [Chloroflexota bacterium]
MKQVRSRGLLLLLPVLLAMMAGIVLYASPLKLNPPLTNATIDEAIFTPDGQHIIYRIKYQDDKSAAIYRVPVMGGESAQLSTRDLDTWFAKPSQFIPSISPDGAYLLYRSNQDEAGSPGTVQCSHKRRRFRFGKSLTAIWSQGEM